MRDLRRGRCAALICAALMLTGCPLYEDSGSGEFHVITSVSDTLPAPSAQSFAALPSAYNDIHIDSYAYAQLSDKEKALYDNILWAACRLMPDVKTDSSISDDEWIKVFGCVYNQETQLFWLSPEAIKGHIYYTETDEEILRKMFAEEEERTSSILAAAAGMSDGEKLKYFHDRIITMNSFAQDGKYSRTIYGGLVAGRVQCEGYAKTMHHLCRAAGIPSMVVTGTNSSGEPHAWNIVMCGGKWYNIDCTWDDPVLSDNIPENIRYNYFLVPGKWIYERSHFNINRKTAGRKTVYFPLPECTSHEENYFYRNGLVFSDADSAASALRSAMSDTAAAGKRSVQIMVTSRSIYDQLRDRAPQYAAWIKERFPSVSGLSDNCDSELLIIEFDLNY